MPMPPRIVDMSGAPTWMKITYAMILFAYAAVMLYGAYSILRKKK